MPKPQRATVGRLAPAARLPPIRCACTGLASLGRCDLASPPFGAVSLYAVAVALAAAPPASLRGLEGLPGC